MGTATPTALCLWLLLISSLPFPSVTAVSEFSLVVSGPTTLQLSPALVVEKSPGLKPGAKVKCERVLIHGLPIIKYLSKFANSMKVKVSCVNQSGYSAKIEICFHRNASLGVGMCPQDQWERLNKGLWIKSMSLFDHKILDIRTEASYSENLEVSIDEEFAYRILFLVLGTVLMSVASCLSKSLVFYYGGAIIMGLFVSILMVLYQGMKLLPIGRKSSPAIFPYGVFVGLGSFILPYLIGSLRSLEIGLSEDMYIALAVSLLLFLAITGGWLGSWFVYKHVRTEDGTIDTRVSHFVKWLIRIVACVMFLQSSEASSLAVEALVGGIIFSSLLRMSGIGKVFRRIKRKLCRLLNLEKALDAYTSLVIKMFASRPSTKAVQGSTTIKLSDSDTFYSTFHGTPDRRNFTESEWESFTKESTQNALEGLVSSPEFSNWAVSHANSLTLAPRNQITHR